MTGTVGFSQTLKPKMNPNPSIPYPQKNHYAPFYLSNYTLRKDLNIPFVNNLAIESYNKFYKRLNPHPNSFVQNLSLPHLPDDLKDCGLET
jgi:hypothetical protein